jgi:hypothetical protein
MTAFLAVEFEPGTDPQRAVNALRQPALVVLALDIGQRDLVATVEAESAASLAAAEAVIRCCPGIRTSAIFAADA